MEFLLVPQDHTILFCLFHKISNNNIFFKVSVLLSVIVSLSVTSLET